MRNLVIFGDTQYAERLYKYIVLEGVDRVIAFTQEKNFVSRKSIQGIPVMNFGELHYIMKEECDGETAEGL